MSEQKCPACSPDSPKCTLCKGTGVVRGTYQLGAWFDANDLRPCRAIMLNFPGGCGAILVCAGGTTTNELIGSVERMIELANPLAGVADPAAQVAKWRAMEEAYSDMHAFISEFHKSYLNDDDGFGLMKHWAKRAYDILAAAKGGE